MTELQIFDVVDATIAIRRDAMGPVRPEVEHLDGTRHRFTVSWIIDAEEFLRDSARRAYDGEWALVPDQTIPHLTWIASGDVKDVTIAEDES